MVNEFGARTSITLHPPRACVLENAKHEHVEERALANDEKCASVNAVIFLLRRGCGAVRACSSAALSRFDTASPASCMIACSPQSTARVPAITSAQFKIQPFRQRLPVLLGELREEVRRLRAEALQQGELEPAAQAGVRLQARVQLREADHLRSGKSDLKKPTLSERGR